MGALIELIIYVLLVVAMWKLFEKAGEEGWKAIIPFYNCFVWFKIITGNGWKMFFMFIPLFNIVYSIMFVFKIAKAYGKSTGFGFGLLFLSPIFYMILGFSDAEYIGPQ